MSELYLTNLLLYQQFKLMIILMDKQFNINTQNLNDLLVKAPLGQF